MAAESSGGSQGSQADSSQHEAEVDSPPPQKKMRVTHTITGNKIYADEKDDWESVATVEGGGEMCTFEFMDVELSLVPTRTIQFSSGVINLPPMQLTTKELNRAMKIRCNSVTVLAAPIYCEVVPYIQVAGTASSDSGDEAPTDEEIPPVFSTAELHVLRRKHKCLYRRLRQAQEPKFQSVFGKCFLSEFCQFLLPDFDCLISTNPKGAYQPGSLNVAWITPARCDRRSFVVLNKQFSSR